VQKVVSQNWYSTQQWFANEPELRLEVKNVLIIIGMQTIVCQLRCILQLNLINLNNV